MSKPVVTVCISTRDRSAMLPDLFAALAAQDLDEPFDVSITDNFSSDDTSAVLARIAPTMPFPVHVHRNDTPQGPAGGRNLAATQTTAPILAFTDDDCRPEPGWLRAGMQRMKADHAVVVGRVLPAPGGISGHPMGRVVSSDHWRFFTTSNVFYRRDDFAAANGFDLDFIGIGGEDTDLGLRICKSGAEPRYEPTAIVRHPIRKPSIRTTVREASRWHSVALLVKKHPEQRELLLSHRVFWRVSHQWMTLALVSLIASLRSPFALIGVVPWLWVRIWRRRSRRTRLRSVIYAPVLALVDVLEIIALLRGSIRDRTFTI